MLVRKLGELGARRIAGAGILAGGQRQRGFEIGARLIRLAAGEEGEAAVEPRLRIGRVEADRGVVAQDRAIEIAGGGERETALVIGRGVPGIMRDRLVVILDGKFEIAVLPARLRPIAIERGAVGIEMDGFVEIRDRPPPVAMAQRDPSAPFIGERDQRAAQRREADHRRADVGIVLVPAIDDGVRGQANQHAQDDQQWYRSFGHLRRWQAEGRPRIPFRRNCHGRVLTPAGTVLCATGHKARKFGRLLRQPQGPREDERPHGLRGG